MFKELQRFGCRTFDVPVLQEIYSGGTFIFTNKLHADSKIASNYFMNKTDTLYNIIFIRHNMK